ncbi:hypothetical protein J4Q44_G00009140 [Coregonus suidteri]|uniref:Uncharacterized protein n=1 Tax=Coregonus suidteri TaxID=861788 RepID=A0AAN8NJ99_9TELE
MYSSGTHADQHLSCPSWNHPTHGFSKPPPLLPMLPSPPAPLIDSTPVSTKCNYICVRVCFDQLCIYLFLLSYFISKEQFFCCCFGHRLLCHLGVRTGLKVGMDGAEMGSRRKGRDGERGRIHDRIQASQSNSISLSWGVYKVQQFILGKIQEAWECSHVHGRATRTYYGSIPITPLRWGSGTQKRSNYW